MSKLMAGLRALASKASEAGPDIMLGASALGDTSGASARGRLREAVLGTLDGEAYDWTMAGRDISAAMAEFGRAHE